MDEAAVVFLGGSITWGSGASEPGRTGYRALVSAYLARRWAPQGVRFVNAALGGTGSDFGLFRAERDVLRHRPRLVFVEFAVNDQDHDPAWRRATFDALLRCLTQGPDAPTVIVVLTTTAPASDAERARVEASRADHRAIGERRGVRVVDAGTALEARCAGGTSMRDFLPDGVHPNDAGHTVYAEAVVEALRRDAAPPIAAQGSGGLDVRMRTPEDAPLPVVCLPNDLYPCAWDLTLGGPSLALPFDGRVVGLAWWVASDAGAIWWRIDDGTWREAVCWDEYSAHFDRLHYLFLARDLPEGSHRLEIAPSEGRVKGSTGHAIRIAAVFSGSLPNAPA